MDEEKYVLFLDILGFKDLINNNTVEEVKEIYDKQVIKSIGPSLFMAKYIYDIELDIEFDTRGNILKDSRQNLLDIHIMSDSIIIWTKDTEVETFRKLLCFTSVFLNNTFICGVPLRGAISIGTISELITPINNIFQSCVIGKGIVNAYNLEGKQNWMGCIIDDKCMKKIPPNYIEPLIASSKYPIVKYKVPIKKKNSKGKIVFDSEINYVINWTNIPGIIQDNIEFFKDNFSRFNKNIEIKDVKNKIQNTFNFFQEYKTKK